jgi:hypothetical protein
MCGICGQVGRAPIANAAGVLRSDRLDERSGGPFPDGAVVPMSFKTLVLETWCRRMSERSLSGRTSSDETENADRAVCV